MRARQFFVVSASCLLAFLLSASASMQAGLDSDYVASVQTISQRVERADPYLADRMRVYFIKTHSHQDPDPYDVFLRVRQNDASISPGSLVGHLAQERFGRFYGIAIAATALPGRLDEQKAADDAQLRSSGVASDTNIPLRLLSDDGKELSFWRKKLVYEESVQAFLANMQKFHPDLVPAFRDFFLAPLKEEDDYPRGFKLYQDRINTVVGKNVTADLNATSLNMVQRAAQAAYKEGLVGKPAQGT